MNRKFLTVIFLSSLYFVASLCVVPHTYTHHHAADAHGASAADAHGGNGGHCVVCQLAKNLSTSLSLHVVVAPLYLASYLPVVLKYTESFIPKESLATVFARGPPNIMFY